MGLAGFGGVAREILESTWKLQYLSYLRSPNTRCYREPCSPFFWCARTLFSRTLVLGGCGNQWESHHFPLRVRFPAGSRIEVVAQRALPADAPKDKSRSVRFFGERPLLGERSYPFPLPPPLIQPPNFTQSLFVCII